MNKDIVINVTNITKTYQLYDSRADRVKEAFHPLRKKYHRPFNALTDVSFQVRKGEFLGIIGRNGSGKSTLLQILCGILQPTVGTVTVNGRISALLELGAGFNPEFTGRENVYLNASILGFSKKEIDGKFDKIEAFADIGEFIDQPVKIYSSGMAVRLAFAVQANVEPDILILDEVFAVGDSYFQAKCTKRMMQLIEQGVTILYVTHSVDSVPQLCDRAIYLEAGNIKQIGSSISVVDTYLRDVRREQYATGLMVDFNEDQNSETTSSNDKLISIKETKTTGQFKKDPSFAEKVQPYRYGTGGARIVHMVLLNAQGQEKDSFGFRETITVRAYIEVYKDLDAFNCCLLLRNKNGIEIMHCTSREYRYKFPLIQRGEKVIVDISFENILKPMEAYSIHYTVNNTYSLEDQEILDLIELAAVFNVRSDPTNPIWYLIWHPFQFSHKIIK
jgi:ABC-type polysaccharide/polyol phosphate transport system ATPase subunit